eukprot:5816266-Pleurochrysis_carterae.AAC.1
MRTVCTRSPAPRASCSTSASRAGWLSLSASSFASRGAATASHCDVRPCTPPSSARICAVPLVAAFTAAAAGWQSPIDMTAAGLRAVADAAAWATAQMPKSSAAGFESCAAHAGPSGQRCRSASRSRRVAAARVSTSCTSVGQVSDTTHTSASRPAMKA